jgi:hypothetical protein
MKSRVSRESSASENYYGIGQVYMRIAAAPLHHFYDITGYVSSRSRFVVR